MSQKSKWYVVWVGRNPGVYSSWPECQKQVIGHPGARFRSFPSRALAEIAFIGEALGKETAGEESMGVQGRGVQGGGGASRSMTSRTVTPLSVTPRSVASGVGKAGPVAPSLTVDAACSGNPGLMEYRGVWFDSGEVAFHHGPFAQGTNNLGEFLALVEGLRLRQSIGFTCPIYSDSQVALGWVLKGRANTTVKESDENRELFRRIAEAEEWLAANPPPRQVMTKWDTAGWGEIPADFGRK